MLEISLHKRFLPIKVGEKKVDLKPCSFKFLKKFQAFKADEVEKIPEIIKEILNNNKQGYIFKDEIIEQIDTADKVNIINEYFDWVLSEIKN